LQVTGIAERGTSGFVFNVKLSDGSSFFLHTQIYISDIPSCGDYLNDYQINLLERSDLYYRCLRKGGELCARAEQSPARLRTKLLKKNFPGDIIKLVLDRLTLLGYLNEERFAESWLKTRLKLKTDSRFFLSNYLRNQGIRREVISLFLEQFCPPDEVLIKRYCKKNIISGKSDNANLKKKLLRKGFSTTSVNHYFTNI